MLFAVRTLILVFLFNVLKFRSGAAGNFIAPISGLSENAFRTVIEIDTVCFVLPL